MEIGFIGTCVGTSLGLIGAILVFSISLRRRVALLVSDEQLKPQDKLRKVEKVIKGYTCTALTIIVFLCALSMLLRYGQENIALYTTLLIALAMVFNAALLFFSLKTEKALRS